jgi:tetratricopeptide (TPR) repeat protein
MFGFLKRDRVAVFERAKQGALRQFEKGHARRALLYFNRATYACPQRASEIAQFYYDNGAYKTATGFYDTALRAGPAPARTYRYAAKAYEKYALKAPQNAKLCKMRARSYRHAEDVIREHQQALG